MDPAIIGAIIGGAAAIAAAIITVVIPLLRKKDKTKDEPKKSFHRICGHIRLTVEKLKIPWDDVGVITHKCLVDHVRKALPLKDGIDGQRRIMYYSACRGLNDFRDLKLVALIGVQQPKEEDIARTAISLFLIDADPRDLKGKAEKVFRRLRSREGQAYEVETFDHDDRRLRIAWGMTVTAELMQATGRARFLEDRDWEQLVLVFSSEPFGPVTRAMTMAEHRKLLGLEDDVNGERTVRDRIVDAMRSLRNVGFTYADLSEATELAEATLKNTDRYRDIVEEWRVLLGLRFRRGGRGGPGRFECEPGVSV